MMSIETLETGVDIPKNGLEPQGTASLEGSGMAPYPLDNGPPLGVALPLPDLFVQAFQLPAPMEPPADMSAGMASPIEPPPLLPPGGLLPSVTGSLPTAFPPPTALSNDSLFPLNFSLPFQPMPTDTNFLSGSLSGALLLPPSGLQPPLLSEDSLEQGHTLGTTPTTPITKSLVDGAMDRPTTSSVSDSFLSVPPLPSTSLAFPPPSCDSNSIHGFPTSSTSSNVLRPPVLSEGDVSNDAMPVEPLKVESIDSHHVTTLSHDIHGHAHPIDYSHLTDSVPSIETAPNDLAPNQRHPLPDSVVEMLQSLASIRVVELQASGIVVCMPPSLQQIAAGGPCGMQGSGLEGPNPYPFGVTAPQGFRLGTSGMMYPTGLDPTKGNGMGTTAESALFGHGLGDYRTNGLWAQPGMRYELAGIGGPELPLPGHMHPYGQAYPHPSRLPGLGGPTDDFERFKPLSLQDIKTRGLIRHIPMAGVQHKQIGQNVREAKRNSFLKKSITPLVCALIDEGYDIRLGEKGRTLLKKEISLRFRVHAHLRESCHKHVCRLKNANVIQLLAMSEITGCLPRCLEIANDYWRAYGARRVDTTDTSGTTVNGTSTAPPRNERGPVTRSCHKRNRKQAIDGEKSADMAPPKKRGRPKQSQSGIEIQPTKRSRTCPMTNPNQDYSLTLPTSAAASTAPPPPGPPSGPLSLPVASSLNPPPVAFHPPDPPPCFGGYLPPTEVPTRPTTDDPPLGGVNIEGPMKELKSLQTTEHETIPKRECPDTPSENGGEIKDRLNKAPLVLGDIGGLMGLEQMLDYHSHTLS